MAMNEPAVTAPVSALLTEADKVLLQRLTEMDEYDTGTSGNQSATIRRLIRQEAKRRKIVISDN